MKRLTSILAISVIAVMSAGAARADIASTTYVDNKVSPVSDKANANAGEIATLKSGKQDKSAMVDSNSENLSESNDTNYPTVAAVYTIATSALGNQVNNKLDKKFTGEADKNKAVITNSNGAITTGTISSAMITDGAVTSAKIADGTIADADIAANAAIAQSKISGLTTSIADAKSAGTAAASALNTYKTSNDAAVAKKADSATMTTELAKKENTSNKVTAISSTSTDTQYPSAKAVYTELAKKQNNITIDSELSSTSTNPVQNKVVNNALAGKQATLTTAQLNAADSGITLAKVTTYDGYGAKITTAQNTANAAIAAPAAATTSTDGVYTLTMKVVDGTRTYAWEQIGR